MKHIKVRYIIGTFAIIAVVVMNFTYAHNNYGIHNMNRITNACATKPLPSYREELEFEYKFCDSYAYDVKVYSKKTPEQIKEDSIKGWKNDSIYGYHVITFTSKSMKEAYNKAKKYAQDVNELGMDYAEVDMKWYITETYRDAHRVNCLQSGNLMYCETKNVECDPLEYESSLER